MNTCTLWAGILLLPQLTLASERRFDVKDDIYAFPQYEVVFHDAYIPQDSAEERLRLDSWQGDDGLTYYDEIMLRGGHRYLCSIPEVQLIVNETHNDVATVDTEHDLVAAADRGWQLLHDMEGQQCLYYTREWWSYVFCYNSHVKQYHAIRVSPNGPQWPPPEDPETPSYILGTYDKIKGSKSIDEGRKPKAGDLQTQSETNFLVQKLDGGTPCDLTGKPRKVEVQYHCSPGMPDRIGWIKETATCAYQMVVYTSRLCDDVVFQPPKEAQLHAITCQEIVTPAEAVSWRPKNAHAASAQIEDGGQARIMVGRVQLGGQKLVGSDGKKIERGRIVMTAEERAEVIAVKKDGHIQSLSNAELKKLGLDPKEIEEFQREMQKMAGNKDWKLEWLDDRNGQLALRATVDAADEKDGLSGDQEASGEGDDQPEDAEEGSEEVFKHEL